MVCPQKDDPAAPPLTDDGVTLLRDLVFVWLYTTITQYDYVVRPAEAEVDIVACLTDRLSDYVKVDQDDLTRFVKSVRNNNACYSTVANAFLGAPSATNLTVELKDGTEANAGWGGGGHPTGAELAKIFV